MPIYEYRCDECEHQLEILQKISDAPATTCPDCGKDGLRKLVSAAAFKLKGTGWYETDFKDKTPNKAANIGNSKKSDDKANSSESKKTGGSNKPPAKTSASNSSTKTG